MSKRGQSCRNAFLLGSHLGGLLSAGYPLHKAPSTAPQPSAQARHVDTMQSPGHLPGQRLLALLTVVI